MEKKKFPIGAEHYLLYEEVGQGVSASVFRALCIPHNEVVAIKILDFERDNCDLNNVSHEAQTMNLVDHPNVLKSHCSFVSDHNLWVVMPYMAGGSCLHILKAVYPEGFGEVVIATVLREVLKALDYLHQHGHIHRDVKAGNILIDTRGAIKLGDFGVSAYLFDSGDRQRTRNTFVGTPCWMAPEVMEQVHGYDFKADIWSFGITALELAHGHAPFSKYPPMKVLLMTLQNAPPGLDYERDNKFSKSFKQMIASCLVKDQSKRPSAKKLLKHSFFKQARSNDYISRKLLEGLPALGDRLQALKRKEEDMVAQKKIPDGQKEEISQNEYKRGISGWNFNLEDMKAQASLIQDEDTISYKDLGDSSSYLSGSDSQEKQLQYQYSSLSQSSEAVDIEENNLIRNQAAPFSSVDSIGTFNIDKYEKSDDDMSIASSSHEQQISQSSSPRNENHFESNLVGKPDLEMNGRFLEGMVAHPHTRRGSSFSSIIGPDTVLSTSKGDSDKMQTHFRSTSSSNGVHIPPTIDELSSSTISKDSKTLVNGDEQDEKIKPVVQQRGRFKVTSENVDIERVAPSPLLQKSISMQVLPQHLGISLQSPSDATPSNHLGHSIFHMLQSVLQTNILQREGVLNLMKQLSYGDSTDGGVSMNITGMEKSLLEGAHDREKELLHELTDLQWRLICAQEELKKYKTENAQYLLYGPFVAELIYSRFWEEGQRHSWCMHILLLCALRNLIHQLWSSFDNILFLNRDRRLSQSGIDFKQIDNEWHWDNFIILQAVVASIAFLSFPSLAKLPIWDTRGIICCILLHLMLSEPLYYWLHRFLHSPNMFPHYHWLHHDSKVPHPFTAGHSTFLEHLILCVIVGVPTLGTSLIGYGSISMLYGYILVFDFLRCLGHTNIEIIPHQCFDTFPLLKYLIYTPTYHRIHHLDMETNFCLFIPLFDLLGKTVNKHSWNLHREINSRASRKGRIPDFVFLAHGVDVISSMHAPFLFRSFSSMPFTTRAFLLPLWPGCLHVILTMWAISKTFMFSFYELRGRLHQTWVVPRFGFQYFLPFASEGINKHIEDAILRADRLGVKVISLAALNKNEALNGGGTLFVDKHPNLNVRVVHGNTLTAAVILNGIPQDVNEVFLAGATSKLGRAISLYLARRRVRVLMLTQSTERFTSIQKEAPMDCQKFLVQVTKYQAAKHCKTWIIGKWTTPREQCWAPPGTHFHQFVVPTIIPFRRDCTYGALAAMKLPEDVDGLGVCEYTLERGAVHACHAGGVVHFLEGWNHHEVGAIDVDRISVVWDAALRHGLKPC